MARAGAGCGTERDTSGAHDGHRAVPALQHEFMATFFTGLQVDSFAAEELQTYLNPEESGNSSAG